MKIPLKQLYTTIKLKSWVPFFKTGGERVIDVMAENGTPVHKFYNFYKECGDDQLEFIEKIINERVKEDSFKELSPVQCAYLGLNALQSLQKELMVETYADEQ